MDIWSWVHDKEYKLNESGNERLAEIMDLISSYTVDGEHGKVDSIVPEGLAIARSLKEKWIEVFLRHWHLQSLILHRFEVGKALPEAIKLLDFGHQEDTKNCPQTICSVQDLAICYSYIDGPGYTEERLAVSQETLDKIDANWPCFVCITSEYASAIIDQKRYQDALDYLDDCDRQLLKFSQELDASDYAIQRVDCLVKLDRFKEARKCLHRVDDHFKGSTYDVDLKISAALVEVSEGKYSEAIKKLPNFESLKDEVATYGDWLDVKYILAMNTQINNDWKLGALFEFCINKMISQGILRISIDLASMACKLALARSRVDTAKLMLKKIENLIPKLPKVLDAKFVLEELRGQAQDYENNSPELIKIVKDRSQLIENLSDDPEFALEQLSAHRRLWPDDEALCVLTAEKLGALSRIDEAIEHLQNFLSQKPDTAAVILELGHTLRIYNFHEKFEKYSSEMLAQSLSLDSVKNLHWVNAHYYYGQKNYEKAKSHLALILDMAPDAYNSRLMLANIERDCGQYENALQQIDTLINLNSEDKSIHWDRMVVASLLKNWQVLRESAAVVEIKFESQEGPIDEEWEGCRIQVKDSNGETSNMFAVRNGPVTARIFSFSEIKERQRHNDTVVFDPGALNKLDQIDDEGDEVDAEGYDTLIYKEIATIESSNYITYDIDGVDPGEKALENIEEILEKSDIIFSKRSVGDYEVYSEKEQKYVDGLYAYILLKESHDLAAVDNVLETISASLQEPLIWRKLLKDLGNEKKLAKHIEIAEDYYID